MWWQQKADLGGKNVEDAWSEKLLQSMQNECIALNPSINIGQIPMAKAVEALFLPLWPSTICF